ncbi:MAG: AAA family ATPase [Chloroflexia bacterium]|nr:AAA family ATPase [Chloroflexia bacterium]
MFNVCPTCGMYEVEREVLADADPVFATAICGSCGARIRFRRRPLYVVTGASGTGKTAICHELTRRQPGFLVLESDILWGAIDVSDGAGLDRYWNAWLRMVRNIHQGPQSVILCGTQVPETLERQPERRYVGETHYLALVADPEEQARRLRARPAWRESGDPAFIKEHVRFNRWLIDHAGAGTPSWDLLDTTDLTVSGTADAVLAWISACHSKSG